MKFLREEKMALLAFIASILIIAAIFYFAYEFSPKIKTAEDNCEVGCPVHAPCHPECKKGIK